MIYPNPSSGKLLITGMKNENNRIEIYDCYGQLLYAKQIIKSNSMVNLTGFINGIYNLRITNNEGEHYEKRFVLLK